MSTRAIRKRLGLEISAILAGAAILGTGAILGAAQGCEPLFPCHDEEISRHPSPDGTREVKVFVRDCGATTTWATHVVVSEKRRILPDATHTVFVADRRRAAPAGPGRGPEVRVQWLAERSLRVSHHRDAGVFRSEREAARVSIEYQQF